MSKPDLVSNSPSRLFTFGCSFTGHLWPTWANIVAYDLKIPLYNYGQGGAGNQFIFNMIMQADSYYQFDKNDLIMINWTNIAREDRYITGKGWVTPGNIYSQGEYSRDFVTKWADDKWYAIRDFAAIKATWELLSNRNCQFHMMKMSDFPAADQWQQNKLVNLSKIENLYNVYLNKIQKSFYDVLWNNDLEYKFQQERSLIHPKYQDGHPTVYEHLLYLETVFKHQFSTETKNIVNDVNDLVVKKIQKYITQGTVHSWEMRFDELYFAKSEHFYTI